MFGVGEQLIRRMQCDSSGFFDSGWILVAEGRPKFVGWVGRGAETHRICKRLN